MASRFKHVLRSWRRNRSQPIAAGILGVPVATYRNWEQGRHEPQGALMNMILLTIAKKTK